MQDGVTQNGVAVEGDAGLQPAGPQAVSPGLAALTLTALGIVFGDIGTSPLYTLKTVVQLAGGKPDPQLALGLLSLLVWTLIIITCVKYVSFVMRVDNDGEGGILALMSLLGVKKAKRPLIVAVGLFGAALIYGDGAITPAISVLSALAAWHGEDRAAVRAGDDGVVPVHRRAGDLWRDAASLRAARA
jgi:KUP system potassium uptake protein